MPIRSRRLKDRESAQRYAHRRAYRQQVIDRFERGGGKCEGCGRVADYVEVAHLFGRRNIIAEPYASWPELCAALCTRVPGALGCHQKYDQYVDDALRHHLQEQARDRVERKLGVRLPALQRHYEPALQIQLMIELYEEEHGEPNQ